MRRGAGTFGAEIGRRSGRGRQVGEIEGAVDSGEAAGSGSAEQAEEDGFGLIVAGVGGGNAVEAMSGGGALEKSVAGAASGGFEREMKQRGEGGDILGFDGGVERELRGELARRSRHRPPSPGREELWLRWRTKSTTAEAGSQSSAKARSRADGIRAAADGHADALAGTDEAMLAQIVFERLSTAT